MSKYTDTVENYFQTVIKKSWTWERLTEAERKRFININFDDIQGTKKQRCLWLNSIYNAYLEGLGYNGWHWRENENGV